MSLTKAQQRAGAYAALAKHGGEALTRNARQGQWNKYLNLVDPDRVLDEAERNKRAEAARKSHMILMSEKAAQTRKMKAQALKKSA